MRHFKFFVTATLSGYKQLILLILRLIVTLTCSTAVMAQTTADFPRDGVFVQQTGEHIYRVTCQGCHMPQGQGAVGAGKYPALANNPRLANPVYPAYVVVNGSHAMPPVGQMLTNEQVVEVVQFVRSNWGNHFLTPLSPAEVQALRISSH